MLMKTLEHNILSHIVLQELYEEPDVSEKDLAFIRRLYSGTLEKLVYLDYVLNQFSKTPVRKMKPVIRTILRMSLYQMQYMDSVPVYTSINEAVKLTRKRGFHNLTGFVNAVLRNADRHANGLVLPDHVKAGAPQWIFDLLTKQYGSQKTQAFFDAVWNASPETYIRICPGKRSPEEIISSLREDGCSVRELESIPLAAAICGFRSIEGLRAFRNGDIIMQDPSSILAAAAALLDVPEPGLVLDVCAAPGGKSLYIAQNSPKTRVIARDLTEGKAAKIRENMERLQTKNIEVQVFDARQKDPSMESRADVVVADLPCSGLGVISKKPDILNRLKPEDLSSLEDLQKQILETVQTYVKENGILVFSTCTVNCGENHENTSWFLESFPFELLQEQQFLPGQDPYDGFYIARFRRKANH